MNFNKLAKESHANAVKHGFWEKRESNEHCLMLVVRRLAKWLKRIEPGSAPTLKPTMNHYWEVARRSRHSSRTHWKMKWRALQFVLATLPERWAWTLTR